MKCFCCGKKLSNDNSIIDEKGFHYLPADIKASNYALTGRAGVGHGEQAFYIIISVHSPKFGQGKPPRPYCPACFLKKLRRAVVAMENALENKGIKVDDDAPEANQKPEEPKAPEITAEEVRRDYPEWCAKLKAAANGREVDDGTLLEIFLKHRKHGMV